MLFKIIGGNCLSRRTCIIQKYEKGELRQNKPQQKAEKEDGWNQKNLKEEPDTTVRHYWP